MYDQGWIREGNACPHCGSGILESVGFISLQPGSLNFYHSLPKYQPTIQILICSLDECGYTQMLAAPGSLSYAKNVLRKKQFGSCRL